MHQVPVFLIIVHVVAFNLEVVTIITWHCHDSLVYFVPAGTTATRLPVLLQSTAVSALRVLHCNGTVVVPCRSMVVQLYLCLYCRRPQGPGPQLQCCKYVHNT